ncbi:hypothetical protein IU399_26155 [Salmonella enterica subsp. enterica serovar Worthington]|nr:hypothetical protein [Salmonella enterica subsp. enterica serovar Worthington]
MYDAVLTWIFRVLILLSPLSGFQPHHLLSFGSRGFDVLRGPAFVPSGIHHHLFENLRRKGITATDGNDCPGQTAKVFACFWAKVLRDVHFTWTGGDGCGCLCPRRQGLKQVNGTGQNNGQGPAATT